jgi:uncharacterized protein
MVGMNELLRKTKKFTQRQLSKEGTGHDWWHIERVLNNARLINKSEKADSFIIDMAILLHDVGDRKVINTDKDDYSIAENFLNKIKIKPEHIEHIMFIIKNMSFSKSLNTKNKDVSKEFYIVQDADRLDALGAMGIARTFAFGGSRGRALHNPTEKAQKITSHKQYKKTQSGEGSSFNHFYEKLLLLKDLMNTKGAKKIAEGRHEFLQHYMKEFLEEWEGRR